MVSTWHLIDINHLFYRSYYGTPPLTNAAGEPTHALYGLMQFLMPMLKKIGDGHVAACLDGPNNFRKNISKLYKSNRKEQPEDLMSQRKYLIPLLEALGIKVFMVDTFEADDVIGTLTRKAEVLGEQSIIVSGDKDFCQLISDRTKIYDYTKNLMLDRQYVYNRYGITPEQFIDYLAIVGDSADCIVGVKGVGAKGASKLLKEYGNLSNIFANVSLMKSSSQQTKLSNGVGSASVSKTLATIDKSVPLDMGENGILRQPIKKEQLKELLLKLNFQSYLKEIFGDDVGLLVGESDL